MLRIIIPVIVTFTVYCLVDALRSQSDDVRGLPRLAWVPIIILLPLFGGIAWLIAGRPRWRDEEAPGTAAEPPRVLGPDDDADFLRRLGDADTRPDAADGDEQAPQDPMTDREAPHDPGIDAAADGGPRSTDGEQPSTGAATGTGRPDGDDSSEAESSETDEHPASDDCPDPDRDGRGHAG